MSLTLAEALTLFRGQLQMLAQKALVVTWVNDYTLNHPAERLNGLPYSPAQLTDMAQALIHGVIARLNALLTLPKVTALFEQLFLYLHNEVGLAALLDNDAPNLCRLADLPAPIVHRFKGLLDEQVYTFLLGLPIAETADAVGEPALADWLRVFLPNMAKCKENQHQVDDLLFTARAASGASGAMTAVFNKLAAVFQRRQMALSPKQSLMLNSLETLKFANNMPNGATSANETGSIDIEADLMSLSDDERMGFEVTMRISAKKLPEVQALYRTLQKSNDLPDWMCKNFSLPAPLLDALRAHSETLNQRILAYPAPALPPRLTSKRVFLQTLLDLHAKNALCPKTLYEASCRPAIFAAPWHKTSQTLQLYQHVRQCLLDGLWFSACLAGEQSPSLRLSANPALLQLLTTRYQLFVDYLNEDCAHADFESYTRWRHDKGRVYAALLDGQYAHQVKPHVIQQLPQRYPCYNAVSFKGWRTSTTEQHMALVIAELKHDLWCLAGGEGPNALIPPAPSVNYQPTPGD